MYQQEKLQNVQKLLETKQKLVDDTWVKNEINNESLKCL